VNKRKDKKSIRLESNSVRSLEHAAEAWARICLYQIKHKQLIANKHKKDYEYNTK